MALLGAGCSRMVSLTFLAIGSLSARVQGIHGPWVSHRLPSLGFFTWFSSCLKSSKTGKLCHANTFQFSACFTLAIVPLDKGSSISKAKDKHERRYRQSCMHKLQSLLELATITVVHQMTLFITGEILNLGQTTQRNVSLSKMILSLL